MQVGLSSIEDLKIVAFVFMTGRNDLVCNNGAVIILCKSSDLYMMLGLPVMQSSFGF